VNSKAVYYSPSIGSRRKSEEKQMGKKQSRALFFCALFFSHFSFQLAFLLVRKVQGTIHRYAVFTIPRKKLEVFF
jgi:hypothetical protein